MTEVTREDLVALIEQRLQRELTDLQQAYRSQSDAVRTRACSIDELLPTEIATAIYQGFPPVQTMRRLSSLRERKYTFKQLRECTPIVEAVTFALQDQRIVTLVERITGMQQLIPDSRLYAGGISSMVKGDYLHPHIDNSHDAERKLYRRINLLYYVSPGWTLAHGGNLQLWDTKVRERVTLASKFNSLILMETNRHSWHSVNSVVGEGPRCCVSNYYFSAGSPDDTKYFHVTDFSAPPEQPVRRLIARLDGRLRTAVRFVKQSGFSRKDFFQ